MPDPPSARAQLEERRRQLGDATTHIEAAVESAALVVRDWDSGWLEPARAELGDVLGGMEPGRPLGRRGRVAEWTRKHAKVIGTALALEDEIEARERADEIASIGPGDDTTEVAEGLEVISFAEEVDVMEDEALAATVDRLGHGYAPLPAAEERRQRLTETHASIAGKVEELEARVAVRLHVGDRPLAQSLYEQRATWEWQLGQVERGLQDAEMQLEGASQRDMDDAALYEAARDQLAARRGRESGAPGQEPNAQELPQRDAEGYGLG